MTSRSCKEVGEGSMVSDGLPASFINSMRTLFDIMDDRHTGYVSFSDIERQWQEDGTQGLPQGVLSALRQVTPASGLLSFDQFCNGLRLSLLRAPCSLTPANSLELIPPIGFPVQQATPTSKYNRPVSAPLLDQELMSIPHSHIESQYQHVTTITEGYCPVYTACYDNKIYSAKPDIRMGVGSMKSTKAHAKYVYSHSQAREIEGSDQQYSRVNFNDHNQGHGVLGPPKPPRILDSDSDKGLKEGRLTQSLERESRADKKLIGGERGNIKMTRRARGGSLERLLDSRDGAPTTASAKLEPHHNTLNRTGMRSALQTWFKEKSKSDMQNDTNNNYRKAALQRMPPPYSVAIESRVAGDGVDSYRGSAPPVPPHGPPPIPPHGSKTAAVPYSSSTSHSKDSGIYVKSCVSKPLSLPSQYQQSHSTYERHIARTNRTASNNLYNAQKHSKRADENHYITMSVNNRSSTKNLSVKGVFKNTGAMHRPLKENRLSTDVDSIGSSVNNKTSGEANINEGGSSLYVTGGNNSLPRSTDNGITGHYVAPQAAQVAVHKKAAKKKEPRRHTLQNGIEQNVARRLRQLEAERDMMYQGLEAVERARNWYKTQLASIAERIRFLPFGPTQEPSLEVQQEKLHFQLARLHEVNALLTSLMNGEAASGLVSHINLALTSKIPSGDNRKSDKMVERIVEQNKLLTEEVTTKSERITSLEGEKAALLRELFQARARTASSVADSTFM